MSSEENPVDTKSEDAGTTEANEEKPTSDDKHDNEEKPSEEAGVNDDNNTKEETTDKVDERNDTPRSNRSYDNKMRDQMMAELERVRKEMMSSASLIKKPAAKPYTPDIFNDLAPYYNTYLIDYAMKDQDPMQRPWGSYNQRETALNIVDPETSLKMDTFPLPPVQSKVPGQLYKIKVWSKNLSGHDKDLGSTRLPPVPPLAVKKLPNPEYQYFKMTYNEVPKFREDVKKMYASIHEQRRQADYDRVKKDWKRMNLNELKELPERSRFHYGKAISTYLGTSKGSLKAVHRLGGDLNDSEAS